MEKGEISSCSSSSFVSNFWSSALRTKSISQRSSETSVLVRSLGLLDLLLIGIGASIGAGIFVVTGTVARDTGPGVTFSYIIAGASCILNALCFAELASRFPALVGGAYLYAYTAFNELTAFIIFMQLMLDYHLTAASIARSLASYVATVIELFPIFKDNIPGWMGHGSEEILGGAVSFNMLAPILLLLVTMILCRGVRESSTVNCVMTTTKIIIVIFVIAVGAFQVDVSNWSPFVPNGFQAVMSGSTVVFFSYVGFDVVANSAEESKRPQRDLPLAIMGSIIVSGTLYVGVCLVITGMVPYQLLGGDAPLAEAFSKKGLKYVSVIISLGAVVGLTTTTLVGLWNQSRMYLGVARDGLLPSILAEVHPKHHTPIYSQLLVGVVPAILAGLFNVNLLSHILSVGALASYSVVAACLVTLRWPDKTVDQDCQSSTPSWWEGIVCLLIIASCGFSAGVIYRYDASFILLIIAIVIATVASIALAFRQVYVDPPGFFCPAVPFVPAVCIFFNIFLFAQLHYLAWARFVILTFISVGIYAFYGQHYSNSPTSDEESDSFYRTLPPEES